MWSPTLSGNSQAPHALVRIRFGTLAFHMFQTGTIAGHQAKQCKAHAYYQR
jgi:hypothetical protein